MHAKNMRKIVDERFPSQISDYLNNFQSGGNVFNNFNLGGYLTYALSPDYKIFIDGRTNILYPIEFYKHYLETISDISVLENDIRKYDIKYAVVTNTPRAHHYFSNTDMLTINFADENFILFSKDNKTAFPVASKLTLYPMCWNDRLSKQAQEEIFLSENFFSSKQYLIKEILEVLKKYLSQENNAASIDKIRPETLSSDSSKRLAAYLTLKTGKYEAANSFYRSIEKKKDNDLLMLSYSSTMLEDYSSAEAMLNNYLVQKGDLKKSPSSNFDSIIILKILTGIQQKSTLQYNSPSNINALKEEPGIDKSLYSQSLRPGIPYDNTCEPIFKSYEDQK